MAKINNNSVLYFSALVAALSGFLFGFDTVVISGAEQTIQRLWQLDDFTHGLTISIALWGTVIGALTGSWPTERWGRKKTLMLVGLLYLVSALGSAIASNVFGLMAFRFMGGLGIGISTIAAPLYITEISPPEQRGKLTGLFQFNIVFGILIAYLSNALLRPMGPDAWRYMLGIQAIPSLIYLILCMRLSESPRWLVLRKNDKPAARAILEKMQTESNASSVETMIERIASSKQNVSESTSFFSKDLSRPIVLAFFIALFNQLSGINAILYYAPRIFEMAGLGNEVAMLQSIGIGLVNLFFTLIGLRLIDKVGRKTLLYWGSCGYILSLGLCSWAFAYNVVSIIPYCIFGFIAAHAIGQGAVIWVFISEIFPNRYRDAGQSFGSSTHWILAALLTLIFPKWVQWFSPSLIFGIFCFLMVLQLLWVHFQVPETKGVSLEELESKMLTSKK